jgi:hypothetical protein
MKCHYMTLKLVCYELQVQLGLLDLFFPPETINLHQYVTRILAHILNTINNSMHCLQCF